MRRPYTLHTTFQHKTGRTIPGYIRHRSRIEQGYEQTYQSETDESTDQGKIGLILDFIGDVIDNKIRRDNGEDIKDMRWFVKEKDKYSWNKGEMEARVLSELNRQRVCTNDDRRLSIIESLIPVYETFARDRY